MIWLVGVLVKSYTYRAHLENVSRAHTITCYARDGADRKSVVKGGGGEEE